MQPINCNIYIMNKLSIKDLLRSMLKESSDEWYSDQDETQADYGYRMNQHMDSRDDVRALLEDLSDNVDHIDVEALRALETILSRIVNEVTRQPAHNGTENLIQLAQRLS